MIKRLLEKTGVLFFIALVSLSTHAEENMKFHGTLVNLPCSVPENDRSLKVHMGTINAHDLYFNQVMRRVPFMLHLEECDTSIAQNVFVTFTGAESAGRRGFLAVDGNQSLASGIVVGLEDEYGNALLLNQASPTHALMTGENILNFSAYIAGEPDALENQTIQTGSFIAIATLILSYE